MAAYKSRYEPLSDDDNDRASILEKRHSKFLEVNVSSFSPVEPPKYQRTSSLLKPRRKRKTLPLDRFFKFCGRQSAVVKWLVVIIISGIPFTVFLLVAIFAIPHDKTIGPNGTYLETAEWTFSTWASFIILYILVGAISSAFSWLCKQSVYLVKFHNFGHALTFRIVLMVWAVLCYIMIPLIFPHVTHWVETLHQAFIFVMIALSIYLVQGIILELLSIRYVSIWLGPRTQRASDELETIKTLQSLVVPNRRVIDPNVMSMMYAAFFGNRVIDNLYRDIAAGKGDEEKWLSYATILWNDIRDGKDSLTRWDLDQRLRTMNHDTTSAYDLFAQLDTSGDSSVTQDEVEELVKRIGHQLNLRTSAQRGIDSILRKLDIILLVIAVIIIIIIYFEIFQPSEAANFKSFFMSISLFGLAISAPLLEFINNCIFVFGKHPYDVGDLIEAKGKKLMVKHISLTHSDFEEGTKPGSSDRGLVVQMSNMSLTTEPITNWTRTADIALKKKEEEEAKEKENGDKETKEKQELRELILLQGAKLKMEGVEVPKEEEEDKGKKDEKNDDKKGK